MITVLPETLEQVFSILPKPSQFQCALVCHAWSPIALDVLWREMPSYLPLLELISPLTCLSSDKWVSEPSILGFQDLNFY